MSDQNEGLIIQIMPADGWVIRYKDEDGNFLRENDMPVVCFALIEEENPHRANKVERNVYPMVNFGEGIVVEMESHVTYDLVLWTERFRAQGGGATSVTTPPESE